MIWRILAKIRCRKIERDLQNVAAIQKKLLTRILKQLEGCLIARDFALDRSTSTARFRQSFPITEHSFYKPYITKILNGEQSILFPGVPVCIAQTGGSTSDPKQFPLGKNLIKSYRQFNLDMAFCYMQDSSNFDILSGRIFLVVAGSDFNPADQSIPVGRATGVMAQIAPTMLKRRYVPDMSVTLNPDIDQKTKKTTEQALENKDNIRMAAGLTPYLIGAFNRLLTHQRDFGAKIQTVEETLPNLKVAFHGGTTFNLYSSTMQRLCGDSIDHRNVYSAAEGPIAYQFKGSSPGLFPAIDGVFFEFLPIEACDQEAPETLLLDEIECGVPYYILLTTQGGLLRYKIGDQVEFISKNPPLLRVLGRVEDQIDLSGEKMGVIEASEALTHAAATLDFTVTDFIVCPASTRVNEDDIRHEWIIESDTVPGTRSALQELLEEKLFENNYRYQQLRNGELALAPPLFRFVSQGTFQSFMEQELAYGQQKLLHMHNDRVCAERLLQYDRH